MAKPYRDPAVGFTDTSLSAKRPRRVTIPGSISGTFPRLKPTAEKPPVQPTAPATPPNPYGLDPRLVPYLGPQLSAIDSQSEARQRALRDFTASILNQLAAIAPQVGSDYDAAIQQSNALAQAGSDTLKAANGNEAIQAILSSAGAPESQRTQVATNLNNVFAGGAAALFGSEGVAPGQQLISDKAAAQTFARDLPGINALAGKQALGSLLAQDDAARRQVLAQVPDLLLKLNAASTSSPRIFGSASSGYFTIDAKTGKVKQLTGAAAGKPQIFGSASGGYFSVTPDGRVQQIVSGTGPKPLPPKVIGSDKAGRYVYDPNTGAMTPLVPPVPQAKKKKYTAAQISRFKASAADSARAAFWGGKLDPTDKTGKRKIVGPAAASTPGPWLKEPITYQQAMVDMINHGIPLSVAQNALNFYWKRPGYGANLEARKNGKVIWTKTEAGRPSVPYQERNRPKGGAAAKPAAYRKFASVAPGADRPGVPTSQAVIDFVGRVGQLAGRPLTITTGTNHNEYVAGTNRQSAHWVGDAADIAASGAELTRLGQDALIAAGMPAAQARQIRGGLFNVGNFQVIFNSSEGGNHWTHLHVGIRRFV